MHVFIYTRAFRYLAMPVKKFVEIPITVVNLRVLTSITLMIYGWKFAVKHRILADHDAFNYSVVLPYLPSCCGIAACSWWRCAVTEQSPWAYMPLIEIINRSTNIDCALERYRIEIALRFNNYLCNYTPRLSNTNNEVPAYGYTRTRRPSFFRVYEAYVKGPYPRDRRGARPI